MNELGGESAANAQLEMANSKEVHDEASEVKEPGHGAREDESGEARPDDRQGSGETGSAEDDKRPDNENIAYEKHELGDKEYLSNRIEPEEDNEFSQETALLEKDDMEQISLNTEDVLSGENNSEALAETEQLDRTGEDLADSDVLPAASDAHDDSHEVQETASEKEELTESAQQSEGNAMNQRMSLR